MRHQQYTAKDYKGFKEMNVKAKINKILVDGESTNI